MSPTSPTIFSLSSAPGRAGVAVVRVSGPQAGHAADLMARPRLKPRIAAGRTIIHPLTAEHLDRGIAIWFPAPRSFTGEDVLELQLHGGPAVIRAVLAALASIPSFRQAEPGEFARRAFANGKIDLAEAEGLADLIDAETEGQRRLALVQVEGRTSALYESWRATLIDGCALVEAAIDFADEPDVESDTVARARAMVETLATAIRAHLADGHRGEIMRDGFRVVLAGPPNVGKSSLLNALARREAAIVSPEAGTTRDLIEVRLDIAGLPVLITDTAGLREASGSVEQEGIRRTLQRTREADLILWLVDAAKPEPALPAELAERAEHVLPVLTKIDLVPGGIPSVLPDDELAISVLSGAGVSELTTRLGAIATARLGDAAGTVVIARARHRQLIEETRAALEAFLAGEPMALELRAEDLRQAADALGRVTGRIDVEDVLDQVFRRFCIGK